jgi:porin
VSNFNGGISTGTTYLGLADLFVHFNTGNSGRWKGGEFLLHGANSHGGEPSANLIGDFQVASNIEAGNHTFLYELWYKQTFSRVVATIGLQDMNAEFANSNVASVFLNSSFGVHSVISDNILAPIFPLTSPGITICWHTTDNICLKTAVYKGCPIDFAENPYNIKWKLNHLRGLLWVTESQFSWAGTETTINELKTGVFFHQHCPESEVINSETGNELSYDYGFYLVGNHEFMQIKKTNRKFSLFYQMGVSPRNDNFGYLGAGCLCSGLLSKTGSDELGLAMAWGMLTKERGRDETTFELTYKVRLNDQIYVQPDMQYVMHPGGTDLQLKNATVGLLRLGMEF